LKAAALQFALAHPAVAIVIPGASRPARLVEDHAALSESIPADFWRELREQQLVDPAAPLPIDSFTNIRPSLPAPHNPQRS